MFKLILIIAIGYFIYRGLKPRSLGGPAGRPPVGGRSGGRIDDVMERDPVCGIFVARGSGVRLDHDGKVLYFCSTACRDSYLASLRSPSGDV